MILSIFHFFHIYFDPLWGFTLVIFWIIANFVLIFKYAFQDPVLFFVGSYGLTVWGVMHVYFWISYELMLNTKIKWIRCILGLDILQKYWVSTRMWRNISYVVILGFLILYSVLTPKSARSSIVTAMFAFSWWAMVIDLLFAGVKILLFLTIVGVIYCCSRWCSKSCKDKLFNFKVEDSDEESEQSEVRPFFLVHYQNNFTF